MAYFGPLLKDPVVMTYNRHILQPNSTLNTRNLLDLLLISVIRVMASLVLFTLIKSSTPLRNGLKLFGGLAARIAMTLLKGYLVIFFTRSLIPGHPIRTLSELRSRQSKGEVDVISYLANSFPGQFHFARIFSYQEVSLAIYVIVL